MRLVQTVRTPDIEDTHVLQERGRRFQLARVLKVTEQMLEEANAGNWERVEELEAQRHHELDECFQMQNEQPSELIAEALATLIYLNEQLVQIVRYAREKTAVNHNDFTRAVFAAKAYSEEF